MTKTFCDVCGREVGYSPESFDEFKIKVKHKWYSWYEHGWEKVVLCKDCEKSFYKLHNCRGNDI